MSEIAYVNISLELWGGVLSLVLLFCTLIYGMRDDARTRRFLLLLGCNALVLFLDACSWIFKGSLAPLNLFMVRFANFGMFAFSYVLYALFTAWLVAYLHTRVEVSRAIYHVSLGICAVSLVLLIVSQFNGMFYYIDGHNLYRRGPLFWLSQGLGILGMTVNAVLILCYRKSLSRLERWALLSYIVLPVMAVVVQIAVYGVALLNLAVTLSLMVVYLNVQAEQSRRMRQNERELANSRISIMLSQIQPHFLFNALTAISRLCDVDSAKAKAAVNDFAAYLRMNLDSLSQRAPIPFEKELKHVKCYLALEKMRFEDELCIVYDIRSQNALLPPLTVQPIVENAVRHGVGRKQGGGIITLCSWEDDDHFYVSVSDDGVGFDPTKPLKDDRTHIGLQNVRERLMAQCGGTMDVQSALGKGTAVTLCVPKAPAA